MNYIISLIVGSVVIGVIIYLIKTLRDTAYDKGASDTERKASDNARQIEDAIMKEESKVEEVSDVIKKMKKGKFGQ